MLTNYHTHTQRCGHAQGTERDYVLAAEGLGLRSLGFSDHCPLHFPENYDSSRIRMPLDELPKYCNAVLQLKEEYAGRMEIHLGFELEYYPAYFDRIMKELEHYPVEYLIQGQHFVGNEIGEPYMGSPLGTDILRRYVDQTVEGLKTGCFICLAHPDLPRFIGDDRDYDREMRRLCEAAADMDIPLEINLLGWRSGRNYPDRRFWKIAGETGNRVIIGSDAHSPDDIADTASEKTALDMAKEFGLKLISDNRLL